MELKKDISNPNVFSIAEGVVYDLPEAPLRAPEPAPVPASTFGWTLVNGLAEAEVNTAWAADQPAAATEFSVDLGDGISVSGTCGKVSIYDGGPQGLQGSGRYLYLAIPLTKGVVTRSGASETVSPGTFVVQAPLAFSPPIPASAAQTASGTQHVLGVDWTDTASSPAIIDYLYSGGGSLGPVPSALLRAGFGAWLQKAAADGRLPKLKSATVTINKTFSGFSWLQLVQASYAYQGSSADAPGVLGILGGTTSPGAFHVLAPDVVPSGSSAGVLIGSQAFVQDVLLPAAAAAFDGASPDEFELLNDDTSISLKSGKTLKLPPAVVESGNYDLTITQFSITLQDRQIVSFVEAKTEVEPGVTLYVDVTLYNGLELITKEDGSRTLNYTVTRAADASHRIHNSTGAIIGKVLMSVILTLIFSVSGAVAKTLGDKIMLLILATVIKGTVTAAQNILPDLLKNGVKAALPSIDEMINTLESSVAWAGKNGKSFAATGAQLNESVQFSGSFK